MLTQWQDAFGELAQAYWTPERLAEVTGGKRLLVTPDRAALLLRALGLLHRDASMPPRQVRKFLQLNHMLRVLAPSLREMMARHERLNIVDAGCGRSYLTLSLAWCFENVWNHPAQIVGVDRNAALIEECQRRTALTGLEHVMRFVASDLASFELPQGEPLHVLISLHACDTATDDALGLGIARKAELIAVAPCCQNELARGWEALDSAEVPGAFSPIWQSPPLRQACAATMTDTFRTLLLGAAGYEARALEFVASSHTPKNTLIRAIRQSDANPSALAEYLALREATGGVGIKLEGLIRNSAFFSAFR